MEDKKHEFRFNLKLPGKLGQWIGERKYRLEFRIELLWVIVGLSLAAIVMGLN